MQTVGQIIMMILLLLSGIGYTVYNYTNGNTSESMAIVCIAILGASLLNMLRGLYRALKDK